MKIDIENLKKKLFIDLNTEEQKKWINFTFIYSKIY